MVAGRCFSVVRRPLSSGRGLFRFLPLSRRPMIVTFLSPLICDATASASMICRWRRVCSIFLILFFAVGPLSAFVDGSEGRRPAAVLPPAWGAPLRNVRANYGHEGRARHPISCRAFPRRLLGPLYHGPQLPQC